MNYYTLEFDAENMGTVPQGKDIPQPYDSEHPYSIRKAKFSNNFDRLIIPSKNFELLYRAKWTDILMINNVPDPYLIVSQNLKKIMEDVKMPDHYFFPIRVEKYKQIKEYFIFVLKDHFLQYINLISCSAEQAVRLTGTSIVERTTISFNSIEDFQQQKVKLEKQNGLIEIKKFDLNSELIEFDIFRLPFEARAGYYIVNEIFAKAVISAKLTGIQFVPFPPPHRSLHHHV
jgi:hypothetical protein